MRSFINKKAKNVNSDRFRRTPVKIDNKVKVEEVKPIVVNAEIIPIPDDIMEKMLTTTAEPTFEPYDIIEDMTKEAPKPKKKKNVKTENKETKIED